jgi:hypothetical protein
MILSRIPVKSTMNQIKDHHRRGHVNGLFLEERPAWKSLPQGFLDTTNYAIKDPQGNYPKHCSHLHCSLLQPSALFIVAVPFVGDFLMKRTITAVLTAGIAILGLVGVGGPANATAPESKTVSSIPYGVHISEFASRLANPNGSAKQFIELCNNTFAPVSIGGLQLFATFGSGQVLPIADVISPTTMLAPGEAFVIASPAFPLPSDQLFTILKSIPDATGIALVNPNLADPFANPLDVLATTWNTPFVSGTPTAPLTQADGAARRSIQRVKFTGDNKVDFTKVQPASPGTCV